MAYKHSMASVKGPGRRGPACGDSDARGKDETLPQAGAQRGERRIPTGAIYSALRLLGFTPASSRNDSSIPFSRVKFEDALGLEVAIVHHNVESISELIIYPGTRPAFCATAELDTTHPVDLIENRRIVAVEPFRS